MRFFKRTSYLLIVTAIFVFLSGCKSIKPAFLFSPTNSEHTFSAQVSDSIFIAPQLNKDFPQAQKTVAFSTKKVKPAASKFSEILPLKNSGKKYFKTSFVVTKSIAVKSRFNRPDNERNQKAFAIDKNSEKQNKVPIPLLVAIGVLTAVIITLFIFLDDIFAKVTKNDFHIEAFLLSILFLLSIIAWIILVINLFLLLPAIYFGIFLGTLILGFFVLRGIRYYKKPKAN